VFMGFLTDPDKWAHGLCAATDTRHRMGATVPDEPHCVLKSAVKKT